MQYMYQTISFPDLSKCHVKQLNDDIVSIASLRFNLLAREWISSFWKQIITWYKCSELVFYGACCFLCISWKKKNYERRQLRQLKKKTVHCVWHNFILSFFRRILVSSFESWSWICRFLGFFFIEYNHMAFEMHKYITVILQWHERQEWLISRLFVQ